MAVALGPRSLTQSIAKHPWSSLRDALVLSAFMIFAVLIARHYDLFTFFEQLAEPEKPISAAEAVVLAALFAGCIYLFVSRRIAEEHCDEAYRFRLESEMRELREMAMHDPLTGLPNRRALLTALDAATATCGPNCQCHAFFLLDLNGFKEVNDRYGHAAGDKVLQLVVERFRRAARPSDLLARLGGDEFAVLSFDVDRRSALAIGTRFAAALRSAVSSEGHSHDVGVAIGGALMPQDGVTAEAVMRRADLAMYRAKEAEGSTLAFFDPEIDALDATSAKASG